MNDGIYWQRKTGAGGFGTSTVCAMFDNFTYFAPGEKDEMWTPGFNLTNVVSARLRFDVAYARYNQTFSDSLEVKVSSNCGTSWSNIYIKGGSTLATVPDQGNQFVPTAAQWRRDTIDISALAAGQSNVKFSFINRGHFGQTVYIDNINLAFPTPTVNAVHPVSVCVGAPVNFTNTSQVSWGYTWNFQGGTPALSSATNPVITYASPGTYTLLLIGVNGTSTASVTKTIQVFSVPNISVAITSNSICSGAGVTLTASGAGTYSWSTGSTSSVIQVTPGSYDHATWAKLVQIPCKRIEP
jgi:PKD repeat protein